MRRDGRSDRAPGAGSLDAMADAVFGAARPADTFVLTTPNASTTRATTGWPTDRRQCRQFASKVPGEFRTGRKTRSRLRHGVPLTTASADADPELGPPTKMDDLRMELTSPTFARAPDRRADSGKVDLRGPDVTATADPVVRICDALGRDDENRPGRHADAFEVLNSCAKSLARTGGGSTLSPADNVGARTASDGRVGQAATTAMQSAGVRFAEAVASAAIARRRPQTRAGSYTTR